MNKKIAMGVLSISAVATTPIIVASACSSASEHVVIRKQEKIQMNSALLLRNFLKDESNDIHLFGDITLTHEQVKEFFAKPENVPVHKNNKHMKRWEKAVADSIEEIEETDAFQGVKDSDAATFPFTYYSIANLKYQCPIKYNPPIKDLLVNWIKGFNENLDKDQAYAIEKYPPIPETLNASKYYEEAYKEFTSFEEREISFEGLSFRNDKKKIETFKNALKLFYSNFYITPKFK
ncbi:hypothetical protein [Mycoplasma todarodis]|uniref:hypothetical protein n=1 Tax=Mycoplasma todarodis TaxID=1937191 RepID=UPI003B33BCA6